MECLSYSRRFFLKNMWFKMFVCIHEIKVLLAQAQQSEWFAYIQDLKGFHEK